MIDSTMKVAEDRPPSDYGSIPNHNLPTSGAPSSTDFNRKRYHPSIAMSILVILLVATIALVLANKKNASAGFTSGYGTSVRSDNTLSDLELKPVTKAKYYPMQPVDHFDPNDDRTWSHPYYVSDDYFEGPGNPIFVILGGEGPIKRILYPFVSKKLAYEFGAYVLQTEHRFYGASQPIGENPTTQELLTLFTPEQAIADYINLIQAVQKELGCSLSRLSPEYCPVVTVGASYPAFLSAIMRQSFAHVIDIAYAASAPMLLNAHHPDTDTNAYYDHVSNVAERAWPGCVKGTRETLKELHRDIINADIEEMSRSLGVCSDRIPEYMRSSPTVFATELTQLVVSVSADANMVYYPPSEDTLLVKTCKIFTNETASPQQRYANFLLALTDTDDYKEALPVGDDCFDLQTQLPDGPNASISSADWSGAGWSRTGTRWEFQVCKDLVIKCGFAGPSSMFYPPREWTLQWFTDHCQSRFGSALSPEPGRLNRLWGFDSLKGTSKILFTNGANDGWITGSYTESPSDSIVVLNFPNGSHHSDLTHEWPRYDTQDIVDGHETIVDVLREWLTDIGNK
jgi:hypothetical protein